MHTGSLTFSTRRLLLNEENLYTKNGLMIEVHEPEKESYRFAVIAHIKRGYLFHCTIEY